MEQTVAVSIICNAYNHEPYIAQCLEGLVTQKTNFVFEILVHDDASTDRTAQIIRDYEVRYPHLLKPIYQTENQYSKGGVGRFQYSRVRGKYIALCEGDDYWTDPLKLQKQFDAMEAHPEVDICAHTAVKEDARTGKTLSVIAPKQTDCVIPVEEVILGGGAYVATNSLFYRAEINGAVPQFRQIIGIDYTTQIHGALRGGMLYLKDCMSVYRYMSMGSWTSGMKKDLSKANAHAERVRKMMHQLDEDTEGRYHDIIEYCILSSEFQRLKNSDRCKELLGPHYKTYLEALPRKERLKIRLKANLPILCVINRKLQNRKKQ